MASRCTTMRVGVPAALQSVMYSASNIVIQAAINSFGTDAVAAWTAYGKMDVIFWMSINAMALAITTFAGQNYGAGEYERLKKGVRVSVAMTACFTVLLSTAFFLLARPLLAIFSPDPDVLEVGVEMVRFLAETGGETPEAALAFDRLGYRYDPERSGPDRPVFLREHRKGEEREGWN